MSSLPPSSSSSSQPTVVLNLQLHASNLLLGDEKNSQEDVYFSLADYRVDVCADKIPNSETVRLKFLFKQQALATVDSAGRDISSRSLGL